MRHRWLFAELRRRNVLRAALLYIGAAWALAQGIAQLGPPLGAPDWVTRWFLVAASIGFPFWIAFAWFYEFTPQGVKRESEIAPDDSIAHSTARKLDFCIIGVLAVAVVLLLTDRFVLRKEASSIVVSDQSIAVLPLVNEGEDPDQRYFADGLSEDLITALSQFAGIKVIGRSSAFQFRNSQADAKTIGKRLGVAHLLEGSVRRVGHAVRITARLIATADASTVWSRHYDRPYQDLFELQDDITEHIAKALRAKLTGGDGTATQSERPPSGNLGAYNAYLHGKFFLAHGTDSDLRKAIDAFMRATELDPRYTAAFAEMSSARIDRAAQFLSGQPKQSQYRKAREEVARALLLNPDLALAHMANTYLLLRVDFDWTNAELAMQRAVQLAPHWSSARALLGELKATLGSPRQAVKLMRQALADDPLQTGWLRNLSVYLLSLGHLDAAETAIHQAIKLQPTFPAFHEHLAVLEIRRDHAAAALAAAQREPQGPWRVIALALAHQIGPDRDVADAALQALIDKYADAAPYQIAQVYALRKDPDRMFAWLDRAWTSRDPGVGDLLFDPFILRYKDDPRFAAYCRTAGLPVPGAARQRQRRDES